MNKLRYIPGDLVYQKDDEGHWNIRSLSALNLALINYKDIKANSSYFRNSRKEWLEKD